ncbi:MAG TPA: hypothetical protein VGA09_16570, partial [Candidatus Binatia bacterium]
MAEWTQARINFASIEYAVSIHVQEPLPRTGTENADPDFSGSIPISDNRQIYAGAKPGARINFASIEYAVFIHVQ